MVDTISKGTDYQDVVDNLPQNECIYLIFQYNYQLDKRKISKNVLIIWCPLNALTKQKVPFAFNKKIFETKFKGIHKTIEADSLQSVSLVKALDFK